MMIGYDGSVVLRSNNMTSGGKNWRSEDLLMNSSYFIAYNNKNRIRIGQRVVRS